MNIASELSTAGQVLLLCLAFSAHAEISLSTQNNLPRHNGEYAITQDLGVTAGHNLFHSFHVFSLGQGETATFSGAPHIENVISRVTGGSASNIDGTIKNTIPDADTYLINPAGIHFGPHTRLDVQGSFHASTAHYLRLQDGGRFDARNPEQSNLSIAPVAAFGFLDTEVQPIAMDSLGLSGWDLPEGVNHSELRVPMGKTVSLIGGDISLQAHGALTTREDSWEREAMIHAPDGQINLVSVASQGEVILTDDAPVLSGFDTLGDIAFTQGRLETNRGDAQGVESGGMSVYLRGHDMTLREGSAIDAEPDDLLAGGVIDLQATGTLIMENSSLSGTTWSSADATAIQVQANNMVLEKNTRISSDSHGDGNAQPVSLMTGQDIIVENSMIASIAYNKGNAAPVRVHSENLYLNAGYISGETRELGQAGNLDIQVRDTLHARGADVVIQDAKPGRGQASNISTTSSPVNRDSGNSGDIVLTARQLILEDGALISSSSIVTNNKTSDSSGDIRIKVQDNMRLSGVNPYGENENGFGSGVYARSKGVNAGESGNIAIEAGALRIEDGAVIESSTDNRAQGGHIDLDVRGELAIRGDASQARLRSPAESQQIYQARFPAIAYNQSASGIYAQSTSRLAQSGDSGAIRIAAEKITLTDKGSISTTSAGGGAAGNIHLRAAQLRLDKQARIASESQLSNRFVIHSPDALQQFLNPGDVIEVADVGNGKSGVFQNVDGRVIAIAPTLDSVPDRETLYGLSGRYAYLPDYWVVRVEDKGDGQAANFRYDSQYFYEVDIDRYVKLETWEVTNAPVTAPLEAYGVTHGVADIAEMEQFKFAQPGMSAFLDNPRPGQPAGYIYQANQWQAVHDTIAAQAQIHGGDAGQIIVNARQGIHLSRQSKITTEAVSAGGGAITLYSGGLLHAQDSSITASVQQGAGNGGNLSMYSEFLIQDQAPITARAIKGAGGNIQIETKGIYRFGGESANPIDASSRFGVSGQVNLDTPTESLNESTFIISGRFLRQNRLQLDECAPVTDLERIDRFEVDVEPEGAPRRAEWYQ